MSSDDTTADDTKTSGTKQLHGAHKVYDAHRAAMTTILGLGHLPDAWHASVTGYLVMAAAAADLFLEFPLDDTYDELAPVFRPGAFATGAGGDGTA